MPWNTQLDRLQLSLELDQALLVAGLHQLVDQGGGRGEGDAEALLAGGQAQAQGDRVTRVGRIIRKLRIDELPQLITVLNGDR